MSTRGAIGFIADGKEYITYNHSDSYPSWLGAKVLSDARKVSKLGIAPIKAAVKEITLVDEDTEPTPAQRKALSKHANPSVNAGEGWYSLLRELQGDLLGYVEAGFMPDGHTFPLDSLFCEYAYIIDLDAGTFQAYRGFQKKSFVKSGRWANIRKPKTWEPSYVGDNYYAPVRLVAQWSLDALPTYEELAKAYGPAGY